MGYVTFSMYPLGKLVVNMMKILQFEPVIMLTETFITFFNVIYFFVFVFSNQVSTLNHFDVVKYLTSEIFSNLLILSIKPFAI